VPHSTHGSETHVRKHVDEGRNRAAHESEHGRDRVLAVGMRARTLD
jgi:hypothetical protein